MDMISRLQSHPLFATFTPQALAEVVRAGTPVTYPVGQLAIQEGEPGEIFGVLISGRMEAVRGFGRGEREHLGYVQAGECFGEMSLLTGQPSTADVVAVAPSEAIVFLHEAIKPILALNAEAVQHLTRLITRRLAPAGEAARRAQPQRVRYSLGAAAPMKVLAISCRRQDVRFSYFDTTSDAPRASGAVTDLGSDRALLTYVGPKGPRQGHTGQGTHAGAVEAILKALTDPDEGAIASAGELSAIGHRVCHGGLRFHAPAVVDEQVKAEIRRLAEWAPLDNPYNLQGIEVCEHLAPGVPQVAVFDTSFHANIPPAAHLYALPEDLSGQAELRRFGFHGISHEGSGRAAAAFLGRGFEELKMVTCHLGRSASMTAIDHGRSVDTSMGLTPLEGLVMATRCGDVDPGLLLHLLRRGGLSAEELSERLFARSGLLGLSGVSDDVLAVADAAEQGNPKALLAMQVFCQRARKYLAGYIGLLGGADAIVFTGGVGQNSPGVRARICQGLDWMGVVLDEMLNRSAQVRAGEAAEISQAHSRSRVLVVGSNEEHTLACKTVSALSRKRVTDVLRQKQRPIPIGISAHHLHLSEAHVEALFGKGRTLTWQADLTQPGQFACVEQVDLVGPKGRIDRVRVLGPVRPETQVEISRTEEYKLGIDAPIRMSGDLDGTPGITLEGPAGRVELDHGVICARRHIHMSPQDAMEFALRDRDVVSIRTPGARSLVFGDVVVRVDPNYCLDMHIDTDEANAAELGSGASGFLDAIQQRA